jgi:AraC family transcriptional regulator
MFNDAYTNLRRQTVSGTVLKEGVYRAGVTLPTHFHEKPNFCLLLKGACIEVLGKKSIDFRPFTLGFLAPGDEHSLQTGSEEIRCFGVEPAPELFARAREYSPGINNSIYVRGGLLLDLFTRIYKEFSRPDSASPLAIEGLILEALVETARRQPGAPEKHPPAWFVQAEELLRTNFRDRLRLSAIAAAVNVHPVHLAREFRRHFNCSMGEYVRRLRIDFACRKLSSSDMPLVTIALAAGFTDQSHFSREFKRITGFSPNQYRNLPSPR